MKLQNFDLVVFDLDDTIINSQRLHLQAYIDAVEKYTNRPVNSMLRLMIEQDLDRGADIALSHTDLSQSHIDSIKELKIKIFDLKYRKMVDVNLDARDVINQLVEANIPVSLITNASQKNTDYYLRKFKLERSFDYIITRDTYGTLKPNAILGYNLYELYNQAFENTVYVGDNANDKLFATNCGWQFLNIKHITL